ncbi:MAG: hypothetical protein ACD_40C00051G0012, partial [uncultured bacterium]
MENSSSNDLEMVKPVLIEANETDGLPTAPQRRFYTRPWFIILTSIILILVSIFLWLGLVAKSTIIQLQSASTHGSAIMTAFEARDLNTAKAELESTKASLAQAKQSFGAVGPLRYIPLLGNYLKDVDHVFIAAQMGTELGDLLIKAIEPYADIMGFMGSAGGDRELATAEDRIIFIAETVEKLSPQMDEISLKLKGISAEFQTINEKRYPKTIMGKEVRSKITTLKTTVAGAAESLGQFQPIVQLLPDLLGNPDAKKYLIMFQNDAELRATGGFLTAYATMKITKGKIEAGISQDIYTLDAGFKRKVPAPDPIKKYLPLVYTWNLRDMNLSPDFKSSMDTFTGYMNEVPGAPDFDALIAIDTQVPVRILEVLGPIGVPGYGGKFSAEIDPR